MSHDINVMAELSKAGAVYVDQHFVYASGQHGPGYINMDPLFPDVDLMAALGAQLVRPFRAEFDTVAGPATGGIVVAFSAASRVTDPPRPKAVWADKVNGGFAFERAGFAGHLAGKRVLIVEDLLTTGGSVRKVCEAARTHGATVIGVSVVCRRGRVTAEDLGVPRLEVLADVDFAATPADQCQLCADNVPIVADIGHGEEYRRQHSGYPGGYVQLLAA